MDKNGEKKFELAPVKGSEIVSCAPGYVDGLLLFKTEEKKYGYYGKDAKIAIDPVYDLATEFSEEMAIVGSLKADNDGYTYSVINKNGKQVFGIQDGYEIVSSSFRGGHIILSKDDRFYLTDIKGEMTKLPEKISSIVDYNSKYIIFKSEGDCGVMDLNGEEIIRPKYNALSFDTEDSFFAQKEYADKNCVRLDSKGEETGKIDFSAIMNLGKFGYLAKDGKTFLLLDDKFKKKGKEEFYEVNIDPFIVEGVVSDYFDMSGVASTLVGMIDGNKAAGMQFGESAAKLLAKETPSASYLKNEYDVDSATKIGSGYRIVANAYFTEDLVDYDYMGWEWNTSSKLASVQIAMKADSDWGEDGAKAIKDAFVQAGFKVLKSNKLKAVYKKGNLVVLAESGPDNCVLGVGDTSVPRT